MILQTDIPVPDVPINVADSLKVVQEAVVEQIKEDPSVLIQTLVDKGLQFGWKLLAAIVLYVIGAWIIKRIRKVLRRVFNRRQLEGSLASFLVSLVTISLYILLIVLAVSTLGINTTSIAALLAAGGMAIGMALSGTVENLAGGIMLMIFKPFKAGDYITAQDYSGYVVEMSIVSTKIRTYDNRIVVIPNGALSSGNIDNYSTLPLRRVEWKVSVEYGSDSNGFINAVQEMLAADERVLDSSTEGAADPFVALTSLNANDISFVIRAWVKSENYWDVYFDDLNLFYTELPKRGFHFAYPHMDVTLLNRKEN